jgi:hypothetical protein
VLLAAATVACAPVYEPAYRLDPPAAPDAAAAQSCLARCAEARTACLLPAREALATCNAQVTLRQDQCRANSRINYTICQSAYAPDGASCFTAICPTLICDAGAVAGCEDSYRHCFAGCGGTVVEERRCVANCPS